MHAETGTGFFVEPDKIVTTIENLAGSVEVIAIRADRFTKIVGNRDIQFFGKRKRRQAMEEAQVSLEGVTAFDAKNNLVLLKAVETGIPLLLGDSTTALIGEKVYTLGYRGAMKYERSVSTLQSRYKHDKWFQIETQFSPGNGGGPVLNSEGEVIGVVAYGTGSAFEDDIATVATVISSNVLKELLARSGEVMPLDRFQKHSRVRAYALEAQATEKAELHDNRGAIKDYNAALKLNPDLVEIYSRRGIVKTRIDNMRGALRDFDKMLRINPVHIFTYNNRASAKAHLGDEQGALDDFNKAIQLNPEYVIAYINQAAVKRRIADIKVDQGDIGGAQQYYQEAIEDYTKVLALVPRNSLGRKHRRYIKRILRLLKSDHQTES